MASRKTEPAEMIYAKDKITRVKGQRMRNKFYMTVEIQVTIPINVLISQMQIPCQRNKYISKKNIKLTKALGLQIPPQINK